MAQVGPCEELENLLREMSGGSVSKDIVVGYNVQRIGTDLRI